MNRAIWERILIALGVLFYLFLFPHGIHGDGTVRYEGLQHFFATGKFDAIVYSFVHPLVSSPLLLLGKVVKNDFWWVSRFNAFVFLGTAFFAARLVRRDWGAEAARNFLLLMFCATMFPKHVTDYYSEVFSASCILLAIFLFREGRSLWVIMLSALSVWNTPGTLVAGAGLLAFFAARSRHWRYLLALPLLPAGVMGEHLLKFGQIFPDAYLHVQGLKNYLPYSGGPGFSYPLFFGLLSVFLSFGKGLVFFVPGLLGLFCSRVWPEKKSDRDLLLASVVYLVGLVLVFSRWWSWFGGWFWGPRFFLFASILGVLVLTFLLRLKELSAPWRVFTFCALALSVWVGCEGVLYGQDFLEDCYVRDPRLEFICQYVPEYSALWRVFAVWPIPQGRKVAYLAYFLLVGCTLLWEPGRKLGQDLRALARSWWREYGPYAAWRF